MIDLILDTSIILGISHLYMDNITKPRSRRERYLFDIKDKLEDRKINCIVTPTILNEIKKGWRRDDGFAEKVVSRFCEIDKFATKGYRALHPGVMEWLSDMTKVSFKGRYCDVL